MDDLMDGKVDGWMDEWMVGLLPFVGWMDRCWMNECL